MQSIIIAISSLLISFVLSKVFQNYFIKNNYIDKIKIRSSHNVLATRSGGSSIVTTLIIISVISYILNFKLFEYSLLVPLLLLFVVGLYDDIYDVDFKLKFIFQIIAAKIIIDNGLVLDNLHGIFGVYDLNSMFAQIFSVFIIVSIINAFNFIDGLDGLASSIIFILLVSFEFFSKYTSDLLFLSIIILSSLLPVLIGNFSRNKKMFLGDSGSLFLGLLASIYIMSILSNFYLIKPEFDLNKIIFIISIFFYPIIDFTRVIFIRIIKGKSPFHADKNHIHHVLLKKYNSHLIVVGIIFTINLLAILLLQFIF
jgi:UDP-GlcNAc:undecaprenyl-phosphate/decaprenyl-phosphate GlcNAc-1-phosphate transferase